jgi:ferredoxin
MSTKVRITQADLGALVADLRAAGTRVVAPVRPKGLGRELVEYASVRNLDDVVLEGPVPARSAKQFFLPATEPLLRWRQNKGEIEIDEVATRFEPTVLLGVRPCDAAAGEILDRVMGWDYRDELWFGRREATTVLSLACSGEDEACFCTAVGLSPASTRGADGLLTRLTDGKQYELEALTPKAKALVSKHQTRFKDASAASEAAKTNKGGKDATSAEQLHAAAAERVKSHLRVELEPIRGWLGRHFEDPFWARVALRCHGCGACAAVCPTCHCFDIMDEPEGVDRGTRRRNWDTCQSALFTLHGSGHNPRRDQAARIRQRITHKFGIYPKKFSETLCTGCGRCVRACAAGMDLLEILGEIHRRAVAAQGAPGATP